MKNFSLAVVVAMILVVAVGCTTNAVVGTLPGGPKISISVPESKFERGTPENPLFGMEEEMRSRIEEGFIECCPQRYESPVKIGDGRQYDYAINRQGKIVGIRVSSKGGTMLIYFVVENDEVSATSWRNRAFSSERGRKVLEKLEEKLPEILGRKGWY